jgi:hypothetical protein
MRSRSRVGRAAPFAFLVADAGVGIADLWLVRAHEPEREPTGGVTVAFQFRGPVRDSVDLLVVFENASAKRATLLRRRSDLGAKSLRWEVLGEDGRPARKTRYGGRYG